VIGRQFRDSRHIFTLQAFAHVSRDGELRDPAHRRHDTYASAATLPMSRN